MARSAPTLARSSRRSRLEARLALELLTTMTPDLELVPGQQIEYSPNALFRGLKALQVAPRGLAYAGL